MKFRYVVRQGGGELRAYDCTAEEARQFYDQLWIFIHSHRAHVLRRYHDECKIADVFGPIARQRGQQEDGSYVMANFFSSWLDGHCLYVGIIQREMKVEIEDTPPPPQNVPLELPSLEPTGD